MALKELFKRGISSLLKRKKTDPVSGESQKLITYSPEAKTQTARQLAKTMSISKTMSINKTMDTNTHIGNEH